MRSLMKRVRGFLEAPVQSGSFEGDSRWHLFMLPFHMDRLRKRGLTPGRDVQHARNEMRFGVLSVYSGEMAYRDMLARRQIRLNLDPMVEIIRTIRNPSILDVGCGDGHIMRYLHHVLHLPLDHFWGFDIQEARVRNARRVLYAGAVFDDREIDDGAAHETLRRQIFPFDILGGRDWPGAMPEKIDVVTMTSVLGAFSDEQKPIVAARICELAPRWILAVLVLIQEEHWEESDDAERFFAPHGYRLVRSEWIPDAFSLDFLRHAVLPRFLWPRFRLAVFSREG